MDAVGFVLLGTVTGIGGGTLRDLLLDIHPILWIERPIYLVVCVGVSLAVFFTAHLVHQRYRLILWFDAVGVALFATVGAERALSTGAAPSHGSASATSRSAAANSPSWSATRARSSSRASGG